MTQPLRLPSLPESIRINTSISNTSILILSSRRQKMPVIQELDPQALCSICMEPKRQFRENSTDLEPIWQLATPCNHSFHQACLKNLLESGAAHLCPLCRAAISHDDLMGICGFGGSVVDFSDGYVSNHTIEYVHFHIIAFEKIEGSRRRIELTECETAQ